MTPPTHRGSLGEGKKKAYLSGFLKQTLTISVVGREVDLDVKQVADGCVGISLWFDTLEHAIEWGGADSNIQVGEYEPDPPSSGRDPKRSPIHPKTTRKG